RIKRAPASFAAPTAARVPPTFTMSNVCGLPARTTPAACTMTDDPFTTRAREPASSRDSARSTPGGSALGLPGLTIPGARPPASRNASAACHPMNPVAPVMLTERFVIQPIGLVTARAGSFDAGVDVVVVLERPGQLAAAIARRDAAPMNLGEQQRIQ